MKLESPSRIRQSRRIFDHRGVPVAPSAAAGVLPRITIVTPSYNQAEYLDECMDSVLSQGYPNLEYIVMDGGSTDGSVDIIKKYAKHLAYWQSGADDGQYPAIEAGLNRATGDVMAWLNSDDRYWPDTLHTVAESFGGNPGVAWLTGRGIAIDGDGMVTAIQHLRSLTQADYLDPERISYLQQESTFWRRDLWQAAGSRIDTSLKLAGDYELWVRFFRHAPLHLVDAVLGCFRIHQGQKTDAGLSAYRTEAAAVARRERERLAMPPDIVPVRNGAVELVTSLVPRHDLYQRLAVRSWIRLGFTVTSINTREELAFLATAYPEVKLIEAPRDGRRQAGKPCIYLDDILDYFRTRSRARLFGIINSDVHLDADASLLPFLEREARGALVIGSRQEVESLDSATGWTYAMGFDYFFFDRSLLDCYPKSDFMLGIPWWDYWMPFLPVQRGYPLKLLKSPIAYHVSHPPAYSRSHMLAFGEHFARLGENSHSVRLHRQYNKLRDETADQRHDDQEGPDILMLAAFARYEIYAAAKPIIWDSSHVNLIENALVDIDESEYLVTAIVSTYASAEFIGDCLGDLVRQTIADRLEILVVDAASPQNERTVVEQFQRQHPNIRYIRTPERIGVYAAWNLAAREARGRYLVSASTNDRLAPHALEMLASVLEERPEVAITYGSSLLTRQPHQTLDRFDFIGAYIWPGFTFRSLLKEPAVGPHAMWRRRLHDRYGYFDEQFAAIADQDFWLRVGRHEELWNIHDITGLYWTTDDSLSGNVARAQAEYREINERHRRPFAYEGWTTTRYFTQGVAARCEERMGQWHVRPAFHVCVRHTGAGFETLSQTIGSLTAQYYHDVRILVVSPQPAPNGIDGDRLRWLTVPAGADWLDAAALALPRAEDDWMLLLTDGDLVDARTFLELGEAINDHPDWRLIFTDEDEISSQAAAPLTVPHFKPGIDPVRLLSAPYLGNAPAISVAWFVQAGRPAGGARGAETYDLTLRTIEALGAGAVGLLQDVLVHRPVGRYSPRAQAAHQQAALGHLQRHGLRGSVVPGINGSQRVIHEHADRPAVLVALLFTGPVALLERALSTLLEKTTYPRFRIIVADCRQQPDPAADAFLAGLEQLGSAQLAVQHAAAPRTVPEAIAEILAGMTEEYLVVWHDSVAAIQEDWLATLMDHGQRDGVAAVAARLVTAEGLLAGGPVELGVCGPGQPLYKGTRMSYCGHDDCLATDRRVSGLDGRCLLVKVTIVRLAGGIAPAAGDLWPLDLAMRLSAIGEMIWTPYAIALVSENMNRMEQADRAWIEGVATVSRDEDWFFRHWFARMGRDPYRNANWDLNCRVQVPEALPALVYDAMPWAPVPKVLARVADETGCGHYRIMAPMRALLAKGMARGGVSLRDLSIAEMSALGAEAWIFQRQVTEEMFAALEHCARYAPGTRIYEIDDLITKIPESSPHFPDFPPDTLDRFRRGIRLCHRLVVATEPLADAYRHLAAETVMVPNCLPNDAWLTLKTRRRGGTRPRVGWAGSVSHEADLLMIGEVVAAMSEEVDWIFLGRCPPALRPFVREVHHPVSIEKYPAKLASLALDLAIAPLEINEFNEAKSHLKLLEYGALGYPVVCSDIVPYQGIYPVTRVRNRPQDWIKAIRELVFDPARAAAEGDRLRAHVLEHWMLEDHLDEWTAAWLR